MQPVLGLHTLPTHTEIVSAALDPFLFSDCGCWAVAHHSEDYFNSVQATEVGQSGLYGQKNPKQNKWRETTTLHSYVSNSKSVAQIRIWNTTSKFSNLFPLRFCHYRAPIPWVNGCKVSSSGNEILQSKRATRTPTSHSRVSLHCVMPDVLKSARLARAGITGIILRLFWGGCSVFHRGSDPPSSELSRGWLSKREALSPKEPTVQAPPEKTLF